MNRIQPLPAALFGIFFAACFASTTHAQGTVHIVVSVDWEGDDLTPTNLTAMERFREDYPQVPLQHFLNAAYYTKPGARGDDVTRAIESVLRAGDEQGLHVHAWRSLVEAAGVPFHTGPSFVDRDVDLRTCGFDCGQDVALTGYSLRQLRQILSFSVDTLTTHGFAKASSFRAGGWMANSTVLHALALEGFTVDCSATDGRYLQQAWDGLRLPGMVSDLWPTTTTLSQPERVSFADGTSIIELPNNGNLSDYVDAESILHTFILNATQMQHSGSDDVVVSIGFHEETAANYLPHLRGGLDRIADWARAHDVAYDFIVGPF